MGEEFTATPEMVAAFLDYFRLSAARLAETVEPKAQALFLTLAGLQIVFHAVRLILASLGGYSAAAPEMIKKLAVLLLISLVVVLSPGLIRATAETFEGIALEAAGQEGLPSPQAVSDNGKRLYHAIHDAYDASGLGRLRFGNVGRSVGGSIAVDFSAIIILLSFVAISVQISLVTMMYWIVMGFALFFMTFAMLQATTGIAEGFLRFAFSLGIRLFVLYLLVAVGGVVAQLFHETIGSANAGSFWSTLNELVAASLLFAAAVMLLPGIFARALSGSLNLGLDRLHAL